MLEPVHPTTVQATAIGPLPGAVCTLRALQATDLAPAGALKKRGLEELALAVGN